MTQFVINRQKTKKLFVFTITLFINSD